MLRPAISLLVLGPLFLVLAAETLHASWSVACDQRVCNLLHEIKDKQDRVQARIVFQSNPKPKENGPGHVPGSVIMAYLPMGIDISQGVTVDFNGTQPFKATLLDCTQEEGCRAAFEYTDLVARALLNSSSLNLSVVDGDNRRRVTFTFELKSFGPAMHSFKKQISELK